MAIEHAKELGLKHKRSICARALRKNTYHAALAKQVTKVVNDIKSW